MAKVPYSKLKCKINDSIKEVKLNDEVTIEVKQYLPIQEKLELIGKVVEFAHDADRNFSNPVKANVIESIEILCTYSNITFTDKQKEDLPKLYDALYSSGIIDLVLNEIPINELNCITHGVKDTIKAVYEYQNSILGVLDIIKTDYSNLELDIDKLNENIANPELLGLVKGVLTNLN